MGRRAHLVLVGIILSATVSPGLAQADSELPTWASWTASQEIARGFRWLDLGDTTRAERAAQRAALLDPGTAASWQLSGACAVARGAWGEARTAANNLLKRDPDDFRTLVWAGHLAVEQGDADGARGFFGRAADLEPGQPAGPLGLALVAARLEGDFERMAQELTAATSRDAALDLASLPLQSGWTPLASDPHFLDALQRVMRPRH